MRGALCPRGNEAGHPEVATRPVLALETEAGTIEIELVEEAAPDAVRWLVRLARGPLFHPEVVRPELGSRAGFYDGLRFEHARPHVELATGTRHPPELFTIETQIDARALGLDRRTVADETAAMKVLQHELLPEFIRNKKTGRVTPRLRRWLDRWFATQDAGFLVGVSRQEIAEALGHVYREGLRSLPPVRGSVALEPVSAQRSSARLVIFLTDRPDRAGRWMVVGRVLRGLDIAESIASRPLIPSPDHSVSRPVDPVVIERGTVGCRSADRSPSPETGEGER